MDLDVNLRLPALFPTALVVRAFRDIRHERWVRRRLKKIGAIEVEGGHGIEHLCDPEVIRAEWPTIYHRCVELILEERLKKKLPAVQ